MTKPLALSLSPERKIYIHTSDPSDHPGLHFEHSSADGRVRVVVVVDDLANVPSNGDSHGRLSPPLTVESRYGGIIEGDVRHDDIVREVAGIDTRRPISEHMWKLTLGLMRVAPRPIEVIVATEHNEKDTMEEEEDMEEKEMESRVVMGTSDSDNEGVYMQLDMTGEVVLSPRDDEEETHVTDDSHEILHELWNDKGRFGPERRVVFHEMSLGVKLHRCPSEGIVRVQSVISTTTKPKLRSSSPVRDPPSPDEGCQGRDGKRVEPGDTIFEVGGVDLRNKVIGVLEWADMVHFIQHVGRPLEMVVANDRTFVPEAKEVSVEKGEQKVEEKEQGAKGGMFDNAFCFNVVADEVCNIPCHVPCGNGVSGGVDPRVYGQLAELGAPITSASGIEVPGLSCSKQGRHPWEKKETQEYDDEDSVYATSVVDGITHSWTKKDDGPMDPPETETLSPPVSPATAKDPTGLRLTSPPKTPGFYSRTHPQSDPTSVIQPPVEPMPRMGGRSSPNEIEEEYLGDTGSVDATPIASVSQLKDMFSPIKKNSSAAEVTRKSSTSLENATIPPSLSSPVSFERDKRRPDPRQAVSDAATLKDIFSPMVNPESPACIAPQSPSTTGDGVSFLTHTTPNTAKLSPCDKFKEKWKGDGRKFQDGLAVSPNKEQSFTSALDDTNESSFHEKFVDHLIDEFCSPNHMSRLSLIGFVDNLSDIVCTPMESRDDSNHHGEKKPKTPLSPSAMEERKQMLSVLPAPQQQQIIDLSPTGSTIGVQDKTSSKSAFDKGPFPELDNSDSPFVGNINFATPNQRVPSSALFAQAFVVQPNLDVGPVNTRWDVQTKSPLFVPRKSHNTLSSQSRRVQPFEPFENNSPGSSNVKSFSAIDFTQLNWNEGGTSLVDAAGGSESENPSFEFNEIAYADSIDANKPTECCSIGDVLEGFVRNCGIELNSTGQEKTMQLPQLTSPRRKNMFSKIRTTKTKKNLNTNKKGEYGNLADDNDDDDDSEGSRNEMKGVRPAHVQLAYQNIRGKSTTRATQFTLLVDDEVCF